MTDTAPPAVDGPLEAGPLVEELIDNMEDNNNAIPLTKGRSGTWSVSHDDSPGGVQTPDNPFTMTAITGRGATQPEGRVHCRPWFRGVGRSTPGAAESEGDFGEGPL